MANRKKSSPKVPPIKLGDDSSRLRLEFRTASELANNPANWREHPKEQLAALRGVIDEVGWAGVALYNERTQRLIDGHARKEIARPDEQVPVLVGSWSEEQERTILATLDPLSAMATANKEALEKLLAGVQTQNESVKAMLAEVAAKAHVPYGWNVPGAGGDDFDVDGALPTGPTRTHPGDLWLIRGGGLEHRLLVGDCTDAANVERLMGGERAEMAWTDPPYGVAIGDKNKFLNSIAPSNRVEENLANDTLDESQLTAMLDAAFLNAAASCTAGASWYVAAPPGPLHLIFAQAMKSLGILRQMLIWKKNNSTFSPMGVSYHWEHEPIFYGWLPNGGHRYHGDRKQTTVWEVDRPMASPEHPTMKPVTLVGRAIEHASVAGEIVLDPFLGSGTTLIAAHRLGRRCFGCEIEPRYGDVILKRAEAEGLTCERAS